MKPGMLISIEGGEGAGKSTVLNAIRDVLLAQGMNVVLTREPGGTSSGEIIRQVLLDPSGSLAAETELLLMFAFLLWNKRKKFGQPHLFPSKTVLLNCKRFKAGWIRLEQLKAIHLSLVRKCYPKTTSVLCTCLSHVFAYWLKHAQVALPQRNVLNF